MKNKLSLTILCFFLAFNTVYSQELGDDVKDLLTRNILSYHFRYALNYDLDLKTNNILSSNDKMFFKDLWPKDDEKLKLKIEDSKHSYPIEGYKIYEVYKKGFKVGNDSVSTFRTLSSFNFDDHYLIAYNVTTNDVKFISGNLFKSQIADDFKLNLKDKYSFLNYLKLRGFQYQVDDIKFERKNNKKLYFSAYSKLMKERIMFIINVDDFDLIETKTQAEVHK